MVFARRTAALRLTAMAAVAASAILISDQLNPDRAFCPMEQACEAARSSLLGTLFGVPTSVLGAMAFGGLFFLTLLPVEWGRRLLQLAGFLAAVAGVGFIVYQATVLKTFCPLCLVADSAGLLAGLITLTWPQPPIRVSGRRLRGEGGTSRLAWTLAGVLAVALPFAWPRPQEPAWIEIPESALARFEDEVQPEADPGLTEDGPVGSAPIGADPTAAAADAPVAPQPPPAHPTAVISTHRWKTPEELAAERAAGGRPAGPEAPAPSATEATPATTPPAPEDAAAGAPPAEPAPRAEPAPPTPAAAAAPEAVARTPAPARRRGPVIVEYLNAYCGHCRSTHNRLEKVLAELGVQTHRRRVYAWASQDYPLWVRACAFARAEGAEDRLFQELLRAPDQTPASIYAAAQRAGLDVLALQCAVEDPDVPEELVRDCRRMKSAGLKGLPTIDIGRRRLMGEQSEDELREAVRAALAQAGAQ